MSTAADKFCNDGASKSNYNDGVCEMTSMLHSMSTITEGNNNNSDNTNNTCANCGKEGNSNDMNTCNRCKSVKYCNAACKKKHRSKHKKKCDRRVAELHDEQLFKQPLHDEEDCPICFMRIPTLTSGSKYNTCCGKMICSGCIHAPVYDNEGNKMEQTCPFCRTPTSSSGEETVERLKKRVEVGDANAINSIGSYYDVGSHGLPLDHTKALEFYHRAGELGNAVSYYNIGRAYGTGDGVKMDTKKATHYYELAAMGGCAHARYNLGCDEANEGNMDRAVKHWMISVSSGDPDSLENIRRMFLNGYATKDDYANALRSHQAYLDAIKSDQRDEAAAAREDYKYIENYYYTKKDV